MEIINEGGLPVIYVGSYKFKDKEQFNIKLFDLKEMGEVLGFELENFVVKKSKKGNNTMLFGVVVPESKMKEIQEEMEAKIKKVKTEGKIILPNNPGILGVDGKPLGEKKKIIV